VDGDDLRPRLTSCAARREGNVNGARADKVLTANAYFGGFPIADALARAPTWCDRPCGRQRVILGPLIHESLEGEGSDLLSAGTSPATCWNAARRQRRTFTDWGQTCRTGLTSGYPSASAGGGQLRHHQAGRHWRLVSVGTVAEQLMYEITDPQAYIVPTLWSLHDGQAEEEGPPGEGFRRHRLCADPTIRSASHMTTAGARPRHPDHRRRCG